MKVKLIAGMLAREEKTFYEAQTRLESLFGEADFNSRVMPFTHTGYYAREMGGGLLRKFLSFKRCIPPENIADVKIETCKIERIMTPPGGGRRINIDPGYVTGAKLVLASTKDYSHRIYLGKGIFAEVTLRFTNKTFRAWEWTYPDYRTREYIDFFNRIRESYVMGDQ